MAAIDEVLREGAGFRMGPFELFDLVGLDVSLPVMESIYRQYYEEPRYRPHPLLRQMLAAGRLGRKSGQGFYRYDGAGQVPVAARRLRQARRCRRCGWASTTNMTARHC